jgi:membrane fusion protein, heavy metal efflux system
MIDRTIQYLRLSVAAWGAAMLLFSCSGKTEAPQSGEGPGNPEAVITLTNEQIDYLGLATDSLRMRTLHESVLANGYIEAPPQNRALVNPLISGHVRTVRVIVGDRVQKGQVLAEMQSLEYIDMQRDYLDLKARADFSELDLERQKVLNQEDAVSQRRLQEAESSWQSTRAQYMGLREKLRLIGTDLEALGRGEVQNLVFLRSPIGGSVRRLEVVPGQYVEPHQNLSELLNTDHLHVQLSLFEKDLIRVRRGQKVIFFDCQPGGAQV